MKKKIYTVLLLGYALLISGCSKFEQNINNGSDQEKKDYVEWGEYQISVDGNVDTDDNPWGHTAGLISVEGVGECVLLTPNTSLEIANVSQKSMISLQAKIHPWVSENSDGAGLEVWIMNDSEDILYQSTVDIGNEDSWKDIHYSLADIEGASRIRFLCNNGTQNDDSADWVIIKSDSEYLSDFGEGGYVRSATYFADEWPVNFWNSEMDHLDTDMAQVKKDGFDSIIIVIPWIEFQTSVEPIEYSDYAFEMLDKVLKAAANAELDVYTRIGYTWDYYSNENIFDRYLDLMGNENTQKAWADYAAHLYEHLSQYDNFKGAFLTWEDSWGCLSVCDLESDLKRTQYAEYIGYQGWIKEHYSLDEYNFAYAVSFKDYSEIPVPHKDEPAMEAMYDFYDEYLNKLLSATQDVFPNISMEVRMDADRVISKDGEDEYYYHSRTFGCENSDYTATMYGIPMGCENNGERISADEALEKTKYMLSGLLSQNKGKPIYVEQFLFMDNNPKFLYNAQIKDEEITDYLEMATDVLLDYTAGYGIWTYRDYANNMIYNNGFLLEERGWNIDGNVLFEKVDGSIACRVDAGDTISQAVPEVRDHYKSEEYMVSLEIPECIENGKIQVTMGSEKQELNITASGVYKMTFRKNDSFDLKIEIISGEYYIDNIKLFSFVQEGGLYDIDNNEGEYIEDIRGLNARLAER